MTQAERTEQFTPGPWITRQFTSGGPLRVYGAPIEGQSLLPPVADIWGAGDAHLIAAAPDLLAALKAMLDPNECTRDVDMAIAAIRKAEGTKP